MKEVLSLLESGIVLTTPIFFLVTLVVLWRILRAAENTIAVTVHLKRQLEVLRRGGLAEGVRTTEQVRDAEEQADSQAR